AQALGEREDAERAQEAARVVEVALELDADHPAPARHLAPAEGVLRMARQAGIVDALHSRGTLEAPGQLGRRLPVALHADRQRLDAAQHQVAVHRTRHGADRVLQEGELLRQLWIAGDERAAHYV